MVGSKDVLCFIKIASLRQWWVILRAHPNQIKSLRTLWAIPIRIHIYFIGYLRILSTICDFVHYRYLHTYWTYFHVSVDSDRFSSYTQALGPSRGAHCNCVPRPRTWLYSSENCHVNLREQQLDYYGLADAWNWAQTTFERNVYIL